MSTFVHLPGAFSDADPPPFLKERIMARVHEDAHIANDEFEYDAYGAQIPILTRVLNRLPGYGSYVPRERIRSHRTSVRRTGSVVVMFCLAFLASAYGFEKVSHAVAKAEEARSHVIDRVRHTRAFAERFSAQPAGAPVITGVQESPITLGHSNASVMDLPPEELRIRSINPTSYSPRTLAPTAQAKSQPLAVPSLSEAETLDLNTLEGAMYFMSDRAGQHFALRPVNGVEAGKASVYWNAQHAQALFTAEDLKPTADDQRYSLCFVLDDGTREQVLAFQALGGGHKQLVLQRTPGPHVVGAQLILESGYKSGRQTRDVLLAAATRLQNK